MKLETVIVKDVFANRPAFGIKGRLFFSTDTNQTFYDTGLAWDLVYTFTAVSFNRIAVSTTGAVTLSAVETVESITTGGTDKTRTLPTAASSPNAVYTAKKKDSGVGIAKILPNGADTIDLASEYDLPTQGNVVRLLSDGVSNWEILGER
jgi:hypothetical protein